MEWSYEQLKKLIGQMMKNRVVELEGVDVIEARNINNISADIAEKLIYKFEVKPK